MQRRPTRSPIMVKRPATSSMASSRTHEVQSSNVKVVIDKRVGRASPSSRPIGDMHQPGNSVLRVFIPIEPLQAETGSFPRLVPQATVDSRTQCKQAGIDSPRFTPKTRPSKTPSIAKTDQVRVVISRPFTPISSPLGCNRSDSDMLLCRSTCSSPAGMRDPASMDSGTGSPKLSLTRGNLSQSIAANSGSSLPRLDRRIQPIAPSSSRYLIPSDPLSICSSPPPGISVDPLSPVKLKAQSAMPACDHTQTCSSTSASYSDALDLQTRPIDPIRTSKPASARGDIRSFFSPTTAPKFSRITPTHVVSKSDGKRPAPTLSQLTLDISNRPTMQVCQECGMSYVLGVEEDQQIHARHHRRVVGGIEWALEEEEHVIWRDELSKDRIVKVTLGSKKSPKLARRIKQILDMVNVSLGAQDLPEEQLAGSALYLFLGESAEGGKKRRRGANGHNGGRVGVVVVVKAVCVAARIDRAFKMVEELAADKENLIKFGEDGSAVFCSRVAQKALIGIHRIWTSPIARRTGLAGKLMDSVTRTFIYNLPLVRLAERRALVAFSQPTESGIKFARAWFKSSCFNLF